MIESHAPERQSELDSLRDQIARVTMERDELRQELERRLDGRLATLESRLDDAVGLIGALGEDRSARQELERRLAASVAINTAAKRAMVSLEQRLEETARAHDDAVAALEQRQAGGRYLILAAIDGRYQLFAAEGPLPQPGGTIELGGTVQVVARDERPIVLALPPAKP